MQGEQKQKVSPPKPPTALGQFAVTTAIYGCMLALFLFVGPVGAVDGWGSDWGWNVWVAYIVCVVAGAALSHLYRRNRWDRFEKESALFITLALYADIAVSRPELGLEPKEGETFDPASIGTPRDWLSGKVLLRVMTLAYGHIKVHLDKHDAATIMVREKCYAAPNLVLALADAYRDLRPVDEEK